MTDPQAVIQEMRERHKSYVPTEGIATCDAGCREDWPCDAAKALDALEVAVEGLESLERGIAENIEETSGSCGPEPQPPEPATERDVNLITLVMYARHYVSLIEEKLRG